MGLIESAETEDIFSKIESMFARLALIGGLQRLSSVRVTPVIAQVKLHRKNILIRHSSKTTQPASRKSKINAAPPPTAEVAKAIDEVEEVEFNFESEILNIMFKIYDGVLPMETLNENFSVTMDEMEPKLIIATARGNITLSVDRTRDLLHVQSYITGHNFYVFEPEEKVWRSVKDGHDARGLIVRDMLRHCTGCPIIS